METENEVCKKIIKWFMREGGADYCSLCGRKGTCKGINISENTCVKEIIKEQQKKEEL